MASIAYDVGESLMRREAIKHGAGEYVIVDATTGETTFQWKTPPAGPCAHEVSK